jgi:7-cyano-7-deazaguanine synthase
MKKAIMLMSAGLDSTVSLALAREAGVEVEVGLCFDYGQRAAAAEWRQSQVLAAHYGLRLEKIELPWLAAINTAALSKDSHEALPEVAIADLDSVIGVTLASAAKVWVPNRNGLFINIAGAYADAAGYAEILTGFNAEEAATFPDNTPQFAEAITRSLAFSTQAQPKVVSYVQHLNKIEILREAVRLAVPIESLWSCYDSGEQHCGRCESCSRLRRALTAGGHPEYLATMFGDADA